MAREDSGRASPVSVQDAPAGMAPSNPAAWSQGVRSIPLQGSNSAGTVALFPSRTPAPVLQKVSDASAKTGVVPYLKNVTLGNDYGKLEEYENQNTLFVHPGLTTPTTFSLDLKRFTADGGRSEVGIRAEIDPRVPADVIKRGGGTAHIVVSAGGKELGQAVVRPGQPFTLQVPAAAGDTLNFSVDANGAPDTNWLLLTIK